MQSLSESNLCQLLLPVSREKSLPFNHYQIQQKYSYDVGTGKLIERATGLSADTSIGSDGYQYTYFKGKSYGTHTLIFFLLKRYLPMSLDFDDENIMNTRIDNLREATTRLNSVNRTTTRAKSGVRGIKLLRTGRWSAKHAGTYLGSFDSKLEAIEAMHAYLLSIGSQFAPAFQALAYPEVVVGKVPSDEWLKETFTLNSAGEVIWKEGKRKGKAAGYQVNKGDLRYIRLNGYDRISSNAVKAVLCPN